MELMWVLLRVPAQKLLSREVTSWSIDDKRVLFDAVTRLQNVDNHLDYIFQQYFSSENKLRS